MDINDSDFAVSSMKSFFIVTPQNASALGWFREWTTDPLIECGEGFAIDCRCIHDLCTGMLIAGFSVSFDGQPLSRDAEGDLVLG